MKIMMMLVWLAAPLMAATLEHSSCKLKFIEHKMIDDLETLTLRNMDQALEDNGFKLERYDGNRSYAVKSVRDLMNLNELIGVLNIRVKYNDVSFWEETKGKEKKVIYAAIRYRVEELIDRENNLFDERDALTVTASTLEGAFVELLAKLPSCIVKEEVVPEPTPEPIPEPTVVPEPEPTATPEPVPTAVPEPVVPQGPDEPGCRCYTGETSSTHLCHNNGVVDVPEFYFIHCKDGKPVYNPKKPGYWLITNYTSCQIDMRCCDSFNYSKKIEGTEMTIGMYCVKLAQTFGSKE